jgi:hypothetical protein
MSLAGTKAGVFGYVAARVSGGALTLVAGAIPRCSDHALNENYRKLPTSVHKFALRAMKTTELRGC